MRGETWSHDGSLDAFLCLISAALELGEAPARVLAEGRGEGDLFAQTATRVFARPSETEAAGAAARIAALSRRLYAACLRAWMSETEIETDLCAVALDCAARGEAALGDYGRPSLSRLAATVRRVVKETHLLEGFARFSPRADGSYVALLEPEFNVLPALAPFFLARFGSEPFALVDLGRRYGLGLVKKGACLSLETLVGSPLLALLPCEDEGEEARLWRSYFRVVENEARHNPSLQRRLMPTRYWRQLTELRT
jgi:probable DNA metabolism protein